MQAEASLKSSISLLGLLIIKTPLIIQQDGAEQAQEPDESPFPLQQPE